MNVDIDLTKSTLLKVGVSGSLDKQNLPGSQYHEIWHSLMGYSPIASPVQYSDGKWAAVGSEGRRNPWVLTTQQGCPLEYIVPSISFCVSILLNCNSPSEVRCRSANQLSGHLKRLSPLSVYVSNPKRP